MDCGSNRSHNKRKHGPQNNLNLTLVVGVNRVAVNDGIQYGLSVEGPTVTDLQLQDVQGRDFLATSTDEMQQNRISTTTALDAEEKMDNRTRNLK